MIILLINKNIIWEIAQKPSWKSRIEFLFSWMIFSIYYSCNKLFRSIVSFFPQYFYNDHVFQWFLLHFFNRNRCFSFKLSTFPLAFLSYWTNFWKNKFFSIFFNCVFTDSYWNIYESNEDFEQCSWEFSQNHWKLFDFFRTNKIYMFIRKNFLNSRSNFINVVKCDKVFAKLIIPISVIKLL